MIAIITAMEVELRDILSRMEAPQPVEKPGLWGYVGRLHGQDVLAAVCGVGKVCAAQCTQMIVSEYKPAAVLHSGIAGAVSSHIRRHTYGGCRLPARRIYPGRSAMGQSHL